MEKRHQNPRFSVRALILILTLLRDRDLNENLWRGGHTHGALNKVFSTPKIAFAPHCD